MPLIKCKMCGGDLAVSPGTSVAECEYCGTKQTVPSADNEQKLALFARANRLRLACEFDKAAGVYESVIAQFPVEAEAYWGIVLCRYGIEYVDDPATGKKIPTCHRSSFDSILEDPDFEQACENADVVARRVYREEAKAIEGIRSSILEVSGREEPYDIFICYKETDENGQRTIDSVIAQDVFDALTERGYRVFFSRVSLEDKLGAEYEPYIFAALNSARVMLVFGSDYEYFNAVWVKNEWSRFLSMIAAGQKKTLIPCYKNVDAYDMPKEFQRLQAQDMGKVGAIQDLLRGVEKILGRNAPRSQAQGEERSRDRTAALSDGMFYEMERHSGGGDLISRVSSIGSNDSNAPFPQGIYSSVVDLRKFSVIYFHVFLKAPFRTSREIEFGLAIYDDMGNRVFFGESSVLAQPNYDKFSKGWILRGTDGSAVGAGTYWAVLWIGDSKAVKYQFQVVDGRQAPQRGLSQEIQEMNDQYAQAEKDRQRQQAIRSLTQERAALQAELNTLHGLFSGGRRRKLENQLFVVESQLRTLTGS